jgi:hypothetical protein
LNPIEHLWRDLKNSCAAKLPSSLTELERICREEWENLPKYRCAKLVASYPRRLKAVIAAKGASTKYYLKVLIYFCDIQVLFLIKLFNYFYLVFNFFLSLWGIVCRWDEGENTFNPF